MKKIFKLNDKFFVVNNIKENEIFNDIKIFCDKCKYLLLEIDDEVICNKCNIRIKKRKNGG